MRVACAVLALLCTACPTTGPRFTDEFAGCQSENEFTELEFKEDAPPTCETWCRIHATDDDGWDPCGSCDGAPYKLHEGLNCREEPLPLPPNAACDDPVPPLAGESIECCCRFLGN